MKLKYILIVSLILTIMTLGAVSASEDIATDDELAVIDDIDEEVVSIDDASEEEVIADDNEEIIAGNDAQDDKLSIDEDEIQWDIRDVNLEEEDDEVVSIDLYNSNEGTLKIYVNDVVKEDLYLSSDDYDEDGEYYLNYVPSDLGISKAGDYKIKLTWDDQLITEKTIHATEYTFVLYAALYEDEGSQSYFEVGDTIIFKVILPNDATNKVTLTVNGKSYDVACKDGSGKVSVSTAGWKLGSYKATASYAGDGKYVPDTISETITLDPKVNYPYVMASGEQEFITFAAPSGNGKMVITGYKWDNNKEDYVQFTSQNVNIVNGQGKYSLASLPVFEEYFFEVDYQIGTISDHITFYLEVKENTPGFSASVTPTELIVGNNVNVQFSGPASNSMVRINVDDKDFKITSLVNGKINEVISGLAVGTHKIKVNLDDATNFYSNTVYVTVKPVPAPAKTTLALKKVKVKKSAKKLTIQATLKINGKPVKGKIIKFKFNKKTYKAKTNAKGVAKIKITKKVLKKLKKGKKVTYSATYGKVTKKVTVKVKK